MTAGYESTLIRPPQKCRSLSILAKASRAVRKTCSMFVPLSPASPPQNYLHELRVEARLRPNGMYQSMPGQACVITQEAKLRV